MQRQPRIHDEGYLARIRQLDCTCCGNNIETQAAHVRFPDRRADKRPTGNSEKPDDRWTLPLCGTCHTKQHRMNEREFYRQAGIDPIFVCLALSRVDADHERGNRIIAVAREGAFVNLMAAG